jgi:hypothetical protein
MNLRKKGQVTIFIIIALVLVAGIGIALYMSQFKGEAVVDKEFFARADIKPEVDSIYDSVLGCLEDNAMKALERIGFQGGYNGQPERSFNMGWTYIPYYYDRGEYLMPEKQFIEEELSAYINDNAIHCINSLNFENFIITAEPHRTQTTIMSKEVRFDIDMTISIEREGKKILFDTKESPIIKQSALDDIYEVAGYITDSHKQDAELVCISCIAEMAEEKDLYVDMLNFGEDSVLVLISENYTAEDKYIFEFLNRYEK